MVNGTLDFPHFVFALRFTDRPMAHTLTPEEFSSTLSLSDVSRFELFISRIVDREQVWALQCDCGWATVTSEGRTCTPFWPDREYAQAFIKGDWQSYQAESIRINRFIGNWLPGLQMDSIHVAIFPNLEMQGIIVEARRVLEALDDELRPKT